MRPQAYGALARHPRLLSPVQQLLREPVYIHQTRLNPKAGFGGGTWDFHQVDKSDSSTG